MIGKKQKPYQKPFIKKEDRMTFPTEVIETSSKRVVCKQCSSCHGCK
jgi:hypothetical protein